MRLDRQLVFTAVANQRRQIATLIDDLGDAQLATSSLCAGWDVKTVAAHLVSVFDDSFWVFMRTALRHASMARAIDELARRRAQSPTAQIVDTLRRRADHPLSPPLFGPLDPSPISWSTAAISGFLSTCRLSPSRSWRQWR